MFLFGITWKIFYSFLIHSALSWWTSTFKIASFFYLRTRRKLFFRFKMRNIFNSPFAPLSREEYTAFTRAKHRLIWTPVLMMLFIFNYAVSFQNFLTSCVCFLSERILHPFLPLSSTLSSTSKRFRSKRIHDEEKRMKKKWQLNFA